jgi:hypothetical protein
MCSRESHERMATTRACRRPARARVAASSRSSVRRRLWAGCRTIATKSSAGAGAARPRSARSRHWSAANPSSARFASVLQAAPSMRWKSGRSISRSTPVAAPITRSTVWAPASTSKACSRGLSGAAGPDSRRRSARAARASSSSWRALGLRRRGWSGPRTAHRSQKRAQLLHHYSPAIAVSSMPRPIGSRPCCRL